MSQVAIVFHAVVFFHCDIRMTIKILRDDRDEVNDDEDNNRTRRRRGRGEY